MKQYRALAGTSITTACEELVSQATLNNEPYSMDFNGIEVIAQPGDTARELAAKWQEDMNRRAEAYRNSPEGQEAARQSQEEVKALQATADSLVRQLNTLDYSNLEQLIGYFETLQPASDRIGVRVNNAAIVNAFRQHGFQVSANVGDAFDENDCENYARYIIGQALECLVGDPSIMGIYHNFAKSWRDKFASAGSPC